MTPPDQPSKHRRTACVALLSLLFCLSWLHLFTGLADNHDFHRDTDRYLAKPVGFHEEPPRDPVELDARYRTHWYDLWEYRPNGYDASKEVLSNSFQWMLAFDVAVNRLCLGSQTFSLIFASVLWRLVLAVCFFALVRWFHASHAQRLGFLVPSLLLWALLYDSNVICMLNSLYEERAGLIFFFLTIVSTLAAIRWRTRSAIVAMGVSLALLSTAKVAYALAPGVLAATLLIAHRQLGRVRALLVACAVAQAIGLWVAWSYPMQKLNAYHASYFGAYLTMTPSELDALAANRSDFERACVGKDAWFDDGRCFQRHREESYRSLLGVYLRHPASIASAVERIRREGIELRLDDGPDRLGKELRFHPGFHQLAIFNVAAHALRGAAWLFYPLIVVFVALLMAVHRQKLVVDTCALVVMTFAFSFGLLQYAAALADGFFELRKHCWLGNVSFGFALIVMTSIVIELIARRDRST